MQVFLPWEDLGSPSIYRMAFVVRDGAAFMRKTCIGNIWPEPQMSILHLLATLTHLTTSNGFCCTAKGAALACDTGMNWKSGQCLITCPGRRIWHLCILSRGYRYPISKTMGIEGPLRSNKSDDAQMIDRAAGVSHLATCNPATARIQPPNEAYHLQTCLGHCLLILSQQNHMVTST